MSTTTELPKLVVNVLTEEQYDEAAQQGLIDENQLYFTTNQTIPNAEDEEF